MLHGFSSVLFMSATFAKTAQVIIAVNEYFQEIYNKENRVYWSWFQRNKECSLRINKTVRFWKEDFR